MSRKSKVVAVLSCAAVGAGAGIAGSAAAPTSKAHKSTQAAGATGVRPPMDGHGRPVHSDEVVLNTAGTAFINATEDNGRVTSVAGGDITLTEGTKTVTYKSVTITVPAGATVIRNGATATLADIKAGDEVHISQSSDGASVFAADASFWPADGPGHRGGPGGPPPFAPGA
ncbi:MAG: hypothetical protein NVSMB51_02680 [Solirubrobacteraceae bacterium]